MISKFGFITSMLCLIMVLVGTIFGDQGLIKVCGLFFILLTYFTFVIPSLLSEDRLKRELVNESWVGRALFIIILLLQIGVPIFVSIYGLFVILR